MTASKIDSELSYQEKIIFVYNNRKCLNMKIFIFEIWNFFHISKLKKFCYFVFHMIEKTSSVNFDLHNFFDRCQCSIDHSRLRVTASRYVYYYILDKIIKEQEKSSRNFNYIRGIFVDTNILILQIWFRSNFRGKTDVQNKDKIGSLQ